MKIFGYELSPPKGVEVSKIKIPGRNGNIPALIVRKEGVTEPAPGVLWIHGGGYLRTVKSERAGMSFIHLPNRIRRILRVQVSK